MSNFLTAFNVVVGVEAGLSTDPSDPGNWTGGAVNKGTLKGTKYGISAAQYPTLDIVNLTLSQAQAIYQSDYWNAVSGDSLPWPLALYVFDCAVNQGQETARKLLQQALGVTADGSIGPLTLAAANGSTVKHWAAFMTLRRHRYEQSPLYAQDGDGWSNRLFIMCMSSGG
jgi:lysozyme family protein